jgi:phospholipid/cholesterol/gamma-HCH transport system permease protein
MQGRRFWVWLAYFRFFSRESNVMTTSTTTVSEPPRLLCDRPAADRLQIRLSGSWLRDLPQPAMAEIEGALGEAPGVAQVVFDCQELQAWDSSLLTFLLRLVRKGEAGGFAVVQEGLPEGVQKLLQLASAVPEKKAGRAEAVRDPLLSQVGNEVLLALGEGANMLAFLGESVQAAGRLVRGKARFRRSDLILLLQECGVKALPIVSLISVLVGLILAFVGSVQLKTFGAQIYIADMVGIAMAREMGAMMTAIIMAGRTGAAFAAQLGTMEVNEEIDALKTLGFSPMEFLVLPRMLALILMMPLLCLYADLMGILGGAVVGIGMFDLTPTQYLLQTSGALGLNDFAIGLVKSSFFGILVAFSGCLRGIQCGRSASAVGSAATSAVVMAIVLIVLFDGLFAVLTEILSI